MIDESKQEGTVTVPVTQYLKLLRVAQETDKNKEEYLNRVKRIETIFSSVQTDIIKLTSMCYTSDVDKMAGNYMQIIDKQKLEHLVRELKIEGLKVGVIKIHGKEFHSLIMKEDI